MSGPAEYADGTTRPVRYVAVADDGGTVTTYVWACDEDDAASWIVRADAGTAARNDSRWMTRLRRAKAAGLAPEAALTTLLREPSALPGSLSTAPSLEALYDLADQPYRRSVWRSSRAALLGLAIGDVMGRPLSALPQQVHHVCRQVARRQGRGVGVREGCL